MRAPKVLFLYTGGTLGMLRRNPGPLAPSHVAEDVLQYVRGLETEVDVEGELLCNLDSSDLGPAHWEAIAAAIERKLSHYDGFVVIHGTDTMAYTACALSYLLENLPKPVVLTGAQRPISFVRTDARANVIHSALCATMGIPEVSICFGPYLFRGNRATKASMFSYEAFESPDFPPLVEMGVEVRRIAPPLQPRGLFRRGRGFCEEVAVLPIVPGATPKVLELLVASGHLGVVIEGFGSGNVPQKGWPQAIEAAAKAGVAVVIHSQCHRGAVDIGAYEGGRAAMEAGAVGSGAMTREATVVKLMYLLGQGLRGDAFREAWKTELAGEG